MAKYQQTSNGGRRINNDRRNEGGNPVIRRQGDNASTIHPLLRCPRDVLMRLQTVERSEIHGVWLLEIIVKVRIKPSPNNTSVVGNTPNRMVRRQLESVSCGTNIASCDVTSIDIPYRVYYSPPCDYPYISCLIYETKQVSPPSFAADLGAKIGSVLSICSPEDLQTLFRYIPSWKSSQFPPSNHDD